MKIELFQLEHEWLGLIIPYKSGVIFTNQVGGTACSHPEVEGFLVPLAGWLEDEAIEVVLDHYRRDPGMAKYLELVRPFLNAGIGLIGDYFNERTEPVELIAEAWVPVTVVDAPALSVVGQFAGMDGILTWSNSD